MGYPKICSNKNSIGVIEKGKELNLIYPHLHKDIKADKVIEPAFPICAQKCPERNYINMIASQELAM